MKSLAQLLLTEEDLNPKYQIYCDMDGVLTDFERRFVDMLRQHGREYFSKQVIDQVTRPKHLKALEGEEEFWNFIDNMGEEFWAQMPWMPNGGQLWDFIKTYDPIILTSPSYQNTSRLGKYQWVQQNLKPTPPVRFKFGEAKADYATPTSILIDDKPSNLAAWKGAGGIAMEVKDGEINSVIKKLKELGYGTRELIKKRV
jgi:5'(3')-deoxyribonucleotidase